MRKFSCVLYMKIKNLNAFVHRDHFSVSNKKNPIFFCPALYLYKSMALVCRIYTYSYVTKKRFQPNSLFSTYIYIIYSYTSSYLSQLSLLLKNFALLTSIHMVHTIPGSGNKFKIHMCNAPHPQLPNISECGCLTTTIKRVLLTI